VPYRQHAGRQGSPFDQAVRREGHAAPAQPVARLEQPRRPLLVPSHARAGADADRRRMTFLTLNTPPARIEVVEAGKGKDLLPLQVAGGFRPNDPLLAALATRYRVVAPLLPGYGRSEGEEGLRDMLDVTLHVLDVLERLKLRKPIVAGHSMGGMIAA